MALRQRVSAVLGVVALLALATSVGALLPVSPAAAQAGAAVTVHARLCPAGYTGSDYYNDCHGNALPDTEYTIAGPQVASGVTNSAGDVTFGGLAAGTYVVDEWNIPFDFIDRLVIYCAPTSAPGTPFPFTATARGAQLTLGAADSVICDFYYVGTNASGIEPATLTIHNRLCPTGYPGGDYYTDCHGSPAPAGLSFTAEGPDVVNATTDGNGNAGFTLTPGTYILYGGVPGEFATLNPFCAYASDPGTAYPITVLGGGVRGPNDPSGIQLTLGEGEAVVCDWYNTPEDQSGRPAPTPTPTPTPNQPIVVLPNTGAGADAPTGGLPLATLAGTVGFAVIAGLVARLRRP